MFAWLLNLGFAGSNVASPITCIDYELDATTTFASTISATTSSDAELEAVSSFVSTIASCP